MAFKECNVDAEDDIESRLSKSDGSRCQVSEEPTSIVPKSGDHTFDNVQVVIDTNPGIECKGYPKEKLSKPYSNKHPKPPRPPKGPMLNASDIELVREISELAALKQARTERMRALKKMKAAKGSSTSGNVAAVVMTILFFIVIILQGACSRGGVLAGSHGSPEPSVANKGLIRMQFDSKPPANEINGPIYQYPKWVLYPYHEYSGEEPSNIRLLRLLCGFRDAPSGSGSWMDDGREVQ